jgi:hypothetical protein
MRALVLNVDDKVYDKLVNFLKILPGDKIKIVEEVLCSKKLERELTERKKEVTTGETIAHEEFWGSVGI